MKKPPLIILTGPTAVGKTSLSIKLAKAVDGEIVSADSMQVYKYMDIGTAKVKPNEMKGVPHYLVDILEPDEKFNVVVFQSKAKEALKKIYDKGHVPIVVGGTHLISRLSCTISILPKMTMIRNIAIILKKWQNKRGMRRFINASGS